MAAGLKDLVLDPGSRTLRRAFEDQVLIPGAVAVISGDLEEELGPEWKVKIGPREAAHIPAYLKTGN
jgi:CO dehydrogenase/acetyl-CoA synthase gamma subunit (corrinoid Fe-S protein)